MELLSIGSAVGAYVLIIALLLFIVNKDLRQEYSLLKVNRE